MADFRRLPWSPTPSVVVRPETAPTRNSRHEPPDAAESDIERTRPATEPPKDWELARVATLLNQHAATVTTTNSRIREARRLIAITGGAPTFIEYTQDLVAGRASRTDAPWVWLLSMARRAVQLGEFGIAAMIGQFVDFTHLNGLAFDSPVDSADMRLWPMSPRLLTPFAEVMLPAISSLPPGWNLSDGSGDSIDRRGLLMVWSLSAEELPNLTADASGVMQEFLQQENLSAAVLPELPTLSRHVRHHWELREKAENADRARGYAGCLDYAMGIEAAARDDRAGSLAPLVAAARAGHTGAAYQGGFAANAVGDTALALALYGQAARAGVASAAFNYAIEVHDQGLADEACYWFARAGELGETKGYAALTAMHQDEAELRRKWARLGAESGDAVCMGEWAACLFQDAQTPGATPNTDLITLARKWAKRGAQRGDPSAMFFAGAIAALQGDRDEGRRWLNQASASGHPEALDFMLNFGL